MRKLTKIEYFRCLQSQRHFIQAAHCMPLEKVIVLVAEGVNERPLKEYAKYKFDTVQLRSRDMVFTRADGTKCYRGFTGKNEYYIHNQALYHVNVQDGHSCIFINC